MLSSIILGYCHLVIWPPIKNSMSEGGVNIFLLAFCSAKSVIPFFLFILNYNSMWWKANCPGVCCSYFAFVNTLFEALQTLPGKVLFDCVYFCIQVIQVSFSKCFYILRHAQFPYLIIKQSMTHCKSVGIQQ